AVGLPRNSEGLPLLRLPTEARHPLALGLAVEGDGVVAMARLSPSETEAHGARLRIDLLALRRHEAEALRDVDGEGEGHLPAAAVGEAHLQAPLPAAAAGGRVQLELLALP